MVHNKDKLLQHLLVGSLPQERDGETGGGENIEILEGDRRSVGCR